MTFSAFREWKEGGVGTEAECRAQALEWVALCFDYGRAADVQFFPLGGP